MNKKPKERTSPQAHNSNKLVSLFLAKYEKQPNNEGWAFTKRLQTDDGYISASTRREVEPKDGRAFAFVMSDLFARRKHLFNNDGTTDDIEKAYAKIEINLKDVLSFMGMSYESRNKKSFIESLKKLIGMEVHIKKDNGFELDYTLLTSVKVDPHNKGVVTIKINEEMDTAFREAGMRYINIERAMRLRSQIAIEFVNFIQVRGQGIRLGEPTAVTFFRHDDVVYYLHLEHLREDDQIRTLKKAIKAAYEQGYPKYKMRRLSRGIIWDKVHETLEELRERQMEIHNKRKR